MARLSPAVDRVVAVLNFLAAHPDEGFTLSELARRLELNKATAHATLGGLAAAGYVLRHPTKLTYSLGPSLIALGAAAQGHSHALEFAREEMRALAERHGLACLATAEVADQMVILARSGMPASLQGLNDVTPVGQRLPLVPPLGTVFKAWASDDEIARWLTLMKRTASDDETERYRAGLAAARRRGYVVGLEADPQATLGRALAQLADDERAEHLRGVVELLVDELGHDEYIPAELEPTASYLVNHVVAPVFDPEGTVEIALSLFGFSGRLSGRQVERLGCDLREACDRVTHATHGRIPHRSAA